jgi:hypothetical protein
VANFSDLQPDFATKLANLRAELTKEGISNSLVSGYRSPEYQNQMYQNHLAKQAGQALPYPNVEAPGVVAKPWSSFHNYGLAADFNLPGGEYSRLATLAPQYGLSGIGPSDPGHIQMGGSLADNISQYKLAGWRPASQPAPAQGAVAYAGQSSSPSRAGTPTPGTQYKSPFDIVTGIESSGQNVNQQIKDKNYDPATGKGNPARGYLQIIDPTWRTYAPTVGVDINKYPTALDAPKDVQYKVGAAIPVNQWGPNSQAALKKAGYSWTGDQTLGQLQSGVINPPATPGTSITSTAVPAGGSGTMLPGFSDQASSDKFAKSATDFSQAMGGGGGDPSQGQQGPPQMPPMPQIPFGGRNVGPLGGQMVGMVAPMVDPRMAAASYGTLLNSVANMQPPPANPTAVAPGAQPGAPPGAGYGPQGQQPGLMPTGLTAMQMQMLSPYALGMQQSPYGTGLTSTGGLGYG